MENPPGPAEAIKRSEAAAGGVVMSKTQWAESPKWKRRMHRAFSIRPSRPTPYTNMRLFLVAAAAISSTMTSSAAGFEVDLEKTELISLHISEANTVDSDEAIAAAAKFLSGYCYTFNPQSAV